MNFWSYAFSIASFLINRPPSFALGFISPWEKVNSVSPPLLALRTFGYACYPYLRPYNKNKLQPRSVECVFLEYPPLSKGYMCLDPTTNKIYTTCYALFNESVFPFADRSNLSNSNVPFSSTISESDWFLSIPLLLVQPHHLLPLLIYLLLQILFLQIFFILQCLALVFLIHPYPLFLHHLILAFQFLIYLLLHHLLHLHLFLSILIPCLQDQSQVSIGLKFLKVTSDYTYQEPPSLVVAIKHP